MRNTTLPEKSSQRTANTLRLRQIMPKESADFYKSRTAFGEALPDIESLRFPFMDKHKITMQVLSYTSPVSDKVPVDEAVRICARANDVLASRIAEHPDRFAGFATLPMSDPKAAAQELERCVRTHKFCGALLAGQYQGHFYDEPQFFPIFAKAAELDVPVYFHPAVISQKIQDYYFKSPSWDIITAGEFASAAFGWHMDVGIHVLRMILAGTFGRAARRKAQAPDSEAHFGALGRARAVIP
ncbi:MAG: amidohydrolase family protein [Synergistaceae bacterium]|nr:amidohydrolase family protein [Synergistaceae bacterium]